MRQLLGGGGAGTVIGVGIPADNDTIFLLQFFHIFK
jgi:hypothetical protein